jgi:DIS3-like exonuclease 2
LVAQRLITHAGGLALLRQHAPPLKSGLQSVIDIAYEKGFEIDGTTSQSLQESLSRMGRECDDKLVMQCITELLMTPMRPAEYIAAGQFEEFDWAHFALNIPYYTHFTSPIRRYPDVLVHRLLQATLDGQEVVEEFPMTEEEIQAICAHCNDKRMASKKAQERSDRVFLSIYLKSNPILSTLGVVISIGEKAFTVYVPSIGVSGMVYLDEHAESFETKVIKYENTGQRSMTLTPRSSGCTPININIFTKLAISCHCKDDPPLDVKLKIVGPWEE